MIKVLKKNGKRVEAYRLGDAEPVLQRLMEEGKLRVLADGTYEVFSREAVQAGSGRGEIAGAGDYVKIDSGGYPYPNDAAFFEKNHRSLGGTVYEQIPQPLQAWTAEEPMCPEVAFLVEKKGLVLDERDPDRYFSAVLWGTREAAARDAVLVFYQVDYAPDGSVQDADYNFVARTEFEKTYTVCS